MRRSLRSWLWRVPIEAEVDEELALHVEMRRREGKPLNAEEMGQLRRACLAIARQRDRQMRLTQWLGEVRADVRFALRQLRQAPGFTVVAALTLALGIGANSAIFGLVDATLLRPLPFAEPNRLVAVVERSPRFSLPWIPMSAPTLRDVIAQNRSFEGLAGIATGLGGGPLVTGPDGQVESAERQNVSSGFFDLLGVRPVAGRTFQRSDEVPNPTVVVFSESLWRSRVIGREQKWSTSGERRRTLLVVLLRDSVSRWLVFRDPGSLADSARV